MRRCCTRPSLSTRCNCSCKARISASCRICSARLCADSCSSLLSNPTALLAFPRVAVGDGSKGSSSVRVRLRLLPPRLRGAPFPFASPSALVARLPPFFPRVPARRLVERLLARVDWLAEGAAAAAVSVASSSGDEGNRCRTGGGEGVGDAARRRRPTRVAASAPSATAAVACMDESGDRSLAGAPPYVRCGNKRSYASNAASLCAVGGGEGDTPCASLSGVRACSGGDAEAEAEAEEDAGGEGAAAAVRLRARLIAYVHSSAAK